MTGYRTKLVEAALTTEDPKTYRLTREQLYRWDLWAASDTLVSADWSGGANDDNIYRVSIYPNGVSVVCFGLARVDSRCEGFYNSVDDLPKWVQERLAVLMITSTETPTAEVEGVGRRISSSTFWVYAPESGA